MILVFANSLIAVMHSQEKRKTTQAVRSHAPHLLRRRSHFGTGAVKQTPPPME
jgi:hypothetical protein